MVIGILKWEGDMTQRKKAGSPGLSREGFGSLFQEEGQDLEL